MRLTPEEIAEFNKIIVVPFNKASLDAQLDTHIKLKVPGIGEDEFFQTGSQLGWIKGSNVVIDTDCVGEVLKDGKVSFEVYGEVRKDGKAISHDAMPRFTPYFMLDDLLAEDSLPEQTLQEFMGSRFGYNTRVFQNMKIIQKEIRKKQK